MEQLRRPIVFAMNGLLGLILFKLITKSSYHDTALVSLILGALICIIQIKWSFKFNLNEIKKISNHSSMFINYINCIFTSILNLVFPYLLFQIDITNYQNSVPLDVMTSISLMALFLLT